MSKSAFSIYQQAHWFIASISKVVKYKEAMRRQVQPIDQNQCVLWQIEVIEGSMRIFEVADDQCAKCAVSSLHP